MASDGVSKSIYIQALNKGDNRTEHQDSRFINRPFIAMSIATILTTLALLHLTSAIFYTNSKESDLPRIGKRHHLNPYILGRFRRPSGTEKQQAYDLSEDTERRISPKQNSEDDIVMFLSRNYNPKGNRVM
ncbi:uncharacterized protein LOC110453145 [Mizuhopecten yessoensis]|uniref:Uncharacterized protein n=1 Tax=Mizuhopecten yessoensis TaxID=6573 RepID=A0A210QI54_MIZYE|nr:uncharacterized protein LOC110453145 [Mizuhopecten yessoensis]OWF48379.1 hypothetical protein KP79_PYT18729 [Mizuhopecten yessoensis]